MPCAALTVALPTDGTAILAIIEFEMLDTMHPVSITALASIE
jgi:hypothetical protein